MQLFLNCIGGHFINFAVCEYYQDETFYLFSKALFESIVTQDPKTLKTYDKIYKKTFAVIESFFRNHLELMLAKFDFALI